MCGTPANCLAPEVVLEGVGVRRYHHLVDKFVDLVIVFAMYVTVFRGLD